MKRCPLLVVVGFGFLLSDSAATAETPPTPATNWPQDLVGLITCRKTTKDWVRMATAYAEPGVIESWGWQENHAKAGMLQTFTLREPIAVFGEKTSQIGFSGTGIVALLKNKTLAQMISDLHLEPFWTGTKTKIYGRVLQSKTEKAGDVTIERKISLTASTSPDFPGVVLAGCSYEIDVR
jgi:hypothetical protein